MGCGGSSKPEDPPSTDNHNVTDQIAAGTGGFAHLASPLFTEYLSMLDGAAAVSVGDIGADDALLVIDMQRDFVPKSDTNPTGGRFGVAEGDHVVQPCVQLIQHFVQQGATVAATRDYHPVDHASFLPSGPFPCHCVQGTDGSKFMPAIAESLAAAKRMASTRVHVAFKAMHEEVDSFGGLPYVDGGHGRISGAGSTKNHEVGVMMGCAAAPWTGSLVLKQSGISAAVAEGSDFELDMDAPPDVFACLKDGVDRQLASLTHVLKSSKRVFVCGLALDFCVLDTCLNAVGLGYKDVYMILDAARAAHIPGLGSFGTGFLSDPSEVQGKMKAANVQLTSIEAVTGIPPSVAIAPSPTAFPNALGPLLLTHAGSKLKLTIADGRYSVASGLGGKLHALLKFAHSKLEGQCSPPSAIPSDWPGKPAGCSQICWAYPLEGVARRALQSTEQLGFLAMSTSAPLSFAAYGGFVLLDEAGKVLGVEAIATDIVQAAKEGIALRFAPPRPWNEAYTSQLMSANRFQPVTLPFMVAAGADKFCWINPGEVLTDAAGVESWAPSSSGAFLYVFRGEGKPIYFPMAETTRASQRL